MVLLAVVACDPPAADPPALNAAIELLPLDGDVWSYTISVRGPADAQCESIELHVADRVTTATIADGTFSADVLLDEGANAVKARCVRGRQLVESAPRNYVVRLVDRPKARGTATIDGADVLFDASTSSLGERHSADITSYRWTFEGASLDGVSARFAVPAADGDYFAQLEVADALGRVDQAGVRIQVNDGVARVPDVMSEGPTWIEGAVVYGAFPTLFGYDGLASVTERLDALLDLGVDVVWLSPITSAPYGDFGYMVTDHFTINPEFGDLDDLRELVGEAHARGMKVIMDMVPNHMANEHRYYVDVLENGEASRYFEFFDDDPAYYFDWEYLPNLDYDVDEIDRLMLEAFAHWVREADVDGFRVDVAWAVLDRDETFWPRWRAELLRMKPDLFLLGEASARDERCFPLFDAAYDWTDDLGVWAWTDVWDNGPPYAPALRAAISTSPTDDLVFRFLDNNDTGSRFWADYGFELARAARSVVMFAPGVASVYTGDEIGADFEPYDTYDPLDWESGDPALYEEIASLIALRHAQPAFKSREAAFVDVEGDVLAFTRGAGAEQVLVLISFEQREATVNVAGTFTDVSTNEQFTDTITIPAYGTRVLRP